MQFYDKNDCKSKNLWPEFAPNLYFFDPALNFFKKFRVESKNLKLFLFIFPAEEEADQGSKGIKVELEYNIDGIMGSDLPNIANYGVQPQYNNAQVQIVEQPAANKLRFR